MYILCIVVFSLLYNLTPAHFYYTYPYVDDDVVEQLPSLFADLHSELVEALKRSHRPLIVELDGLLYNLDETDFERTRQTNSQSMLDIRMLVYWYKKNPNPMMESVRGSFSVLVRLDMITSFGSNSNALPFPQCVYVMDVENRKVPGKILDDLFFTNDEEVRKSLGDQRVLPISDKGRKVIWRYYQDQNQFSDFRPKHYSRMLYFSVITITTVGYGDMVPVNLVARSLAASEALIGILLIGAFLNALAYERNLLDSYFGAMKTKHPKKDTQIKDDWHQIDY